MEKNVFFLSIIASAKMDQTLNEEIMLVAKHLKMCVRRVVNIFVASCIK